MVNIEQYGSKILAAHFAAVMKTESEPEEFKDFVHSYRAEYQDLKRWWEDMDALRVIRAAEHCIRNLPPEMELSPNPIEKLAVGENGIIQFAGEPIGEIYSYHRTVLPQEMQIKIAYDSLIERFMGFLQREKCAIRLSENDLAVQIFVPRIGRNAEFDLSFEWDEFIKFAYSRNELYKSFVLFVNHIKIAQTNRPGAGVGYIRFPPVTKEMAEYLAAFYFATLKNQILYDRAYSDSNKAVQNAQTKVAEYNSRLNQSTLTLQKKVLNEKKLEEWQTKLSLARDEFENVKQTNQEVLNFSLSELHEQIGDENFKRIKELSRQFHGRGIAQFGPSVKTKSKNGNIEGTIVDILNEPLSLLTCPLVSINQIPKFMERRAGDMKGANFCYSCGKLFSKEDKKYEANRFVLGDPSKRPQSGGSETRPNVCGECMTVAFACPIKLTSGAIVVQLGPRDQTDQSFSCENHLRMLTFEELNLVAGRYLLINCWESVSSGNSRTLVSEKIGEVQYTLWRVACIFPAAALHPMKFTLFSGGTKIPLKTRHFVWLSLLNEIFSPNLVVDQRDNIPLGQAIRLIQKDEVIDAIYKMVTVDPDKKLANQLRKTSFRENRTLEELREKHCTLLERLSEKGENSKMDQAQFFRHVAGLTGLTYAFCDLVRSKVNDNKKLDTEREVKKLLEKVENPNFFNYAASEPLSGTLATMFRNDDNYFCYDEAKSLLTEELNLDLSGRKESMSEKGQLQIYIYFDDIVNAYTVLFEKYYKSVNEQRKLCYQLKLSLYAKFAWLFQKTSKGE
ncbi:hypothetical protein C6499_05315 [Candidatus Poribacteria bacterium]|nr:MAG: hypothetical protein C6499_05315 [Candidatus Poribacteria bacterium]